MLTSEPSSRLRIDVPSLPRKPRSASIVSAKAAGASRISCQLKLENEDGAKQSEVIEFVQGVDSSKSQYNFNDGVTLAGLGCH